MMRRISLLALALTSGLAAVAAEAAVLPVEATLEIEVATIAPQSFVSTGVATVNGSGGGLHVQSLALGAGLVGGTVVQPVTDPAAAPISALWLDVSNAAGSVAETSGGTLQGAIALPGFAKICLYGVSNACSDSLSNLSVPLTPIGAGGIATVQGVVNLTVYGVPWTTGTAGIGSITRMGFAQGPASATSSTAQPGGIVQLVTPIRIRTGIGVDDPIPAFATLTLRFVPEPATLVLLATGIGALAWAGRRRAG